MATIFVSPGVYTREQDFSAFASRIGITRLGLVGKTLKGPAFEPIKVTSTDEYLLRFGSTDVNYPLPYVANAFLSQANELVITRLLGKVGFTNSNAWIIAARTDGVQSGSTLAIIRSKRSGIPPYDSYYSAETDLVIGGVTTPLAPFVLSGVTGPSSATTYTVSLDETRDDYIVKILGKSPQITTGNPDFYVERIYPHFIREATHRNEMTGLSTSLVYSTQPEYKNFENIYTNAITPWVVSRVIGTHVRRLFRAQTIADGDTANNEIKISIANLDIVNYTFDLLVRNFNDTDALASSSALERWSNLSLDPDQPNYIAKVIGTTDESFPRKSMFITIDMQENHPVKTVPAGFEGYSLRSSGISGITSADIYYKTEYFSGDSKFKTYLGISELGYTGLTQSVIGSRNAVKSVEYDLFAYDGATESGMTQVKGFHMENLADSTSFVSGNKNSLTAYTNSTGTLIDKALLKFTFAPAGGFDGWNKYALYADLFEEFTDAYTDNVDAFKAGIDLMANPESVDINLFATPGIDFENNTNLISYALEMVEDRTDSLYIMDAPRLTVGTEKGTPEEVVSLLESTGIDSNYAATYWPWVQMQDANSGKYSYQAPTFMVLRSIAYTDNVAAPWIAPAGELRGLAGPSVIRADIKLKKSERNTLYQGRVNPIATTISTGVKVDGQKTLQFRQSALDRINVRRLLLQVRRLVASASQALVFEQNDQTLRDQFLAKVEPILLQIQNQRGLSGFKVVMDDSNNTNDTIDRNTLVGKIQLKPTRTAEFIDLTFQVLPTGASFEDF